MNKSTPLHCLAALFLLLPLASTQAGEYIHTESVPYTQEIPWGITGSAGGTSDDFYGGVELLYPLWFDGDTLLFLYPEVEIADRDRQAYALGLGLRHFFEEWNAIAGISAFWDITSSTYDNTYNGFGLSGEILTKWIDARLNWYLNSNDQNLIDSQTQNSSFSSSSTSTSFGSPFAQGNQILQPSTTTTTTRTTDVSQTFERFEAAMDGLDVEAGFQVPYFKELTAGMELRFFAGYYTYDNPFGDDIEGFKARGELRVTEWLTGDIAYYEDEELFGGNVYGGARIHFPLGKIERPVHVGGGYTPASHAPASYGKGGIGKAPVTFGKTIAAPTPEPPDNIAHRLTENIIRTPRIITADSGYIENEEKRKESTSTTRKSSSSTKVVLDDVVFVNNGPATDEGVAEGSKKKAVKKGDPLPPARGTAENPAYFVQEGVDIAENKVNMGWEGNVFVQGGGPDYFEDVNLPTSMNLYGQVPAYGGYTFGGPVKPVIDGGISGGNFEYATINAFTINGGRRTLDPILNDGLGDGIYLENVPWIKITNNMINDAGDNANHDGADGIHAELNNGQDLTAWIEGNMVFRSREHGITMNVFNGGNASAHVIGNTSNNNGQSGFGNGLFVSADGGSVFLDAEDSNFISNATRGIDVTALNGIAGNSSPATLKNVHANFNGTDGASFVTQTGNVELAVYDSAFNNNGFGLNQVFVEGDEAPEQIVFNGDGLRIEANNGSILFDADNTEFNSNYDQGLILIANQNISGNNSPVVLNYVDASFNGTNGAAFNANNGNLELVANNSQFDNNGQQGFQGSGLVGSAPNGTIRFDADWTTFNNNLDRGLDLAAGFGISGNNSPAHLVGVNANFNGQDGATFNTQNGNIALYSRDSTFNNNGFGIDFIETGDGDEAPEQVFFDGDGLRAEAANGSIFFDATNTNFNSNADQGLILIANQSIIGNNSPVMLKNVQANFNGSNGAAFNPANGEIDLSIWGSEFNNNGQFVSGSGLFVNAPNATSVTVAADNSDFNSNGFGFGSRGIFIQNGGGGLTDLDLHYVNANFNGEQGVFVLVQNTAANIDADIHNSNFNQNQQRGLHFQTQPGGDIDLLLKHVNATGNVNNGGIFAITEGTGGSIDVRAYDLNIDNNGNHGLQALVNGAGNVHTLDAFFEGVRASDNQNEGIFLQNNSDGGIDAEGWNIIANNSGFHGIFIQKNGGVPGSLVADFGQITTNDSQAEGFFVQNNAGGFTDVSLTNATAVDNDNYGVFIQRNGPVNGVLLVDITHTNANNNGNGGIFIQNNAGGGIFGEIAYNETNDNGTNINGYGIFAQNNGAAPALINLDFRENFANRNSEGGIFVQNNAGGGISGDMSWITANNNINNNGIFVQNNGASGNIDMDFEGNTTNGNGQGGTFVQNNAGGGGLLTSFRYNEASGNQNGAGIFANASGPFVGDIKENVANSNVNGDGIQLGDALNMNGPSFFNGNVWGNTANMNGDDGIDLYVNFGNWNGNIDYNTTNNNNDEGLQVLGVIDFNGDIVGNTANMNGANQAGIRIGVDFDFTGDIKDNTANNNANGTGILLEGVNGFTGDFTWNTANGNGTNSNSAGIDLDIDLDFIGDISHNTANNNGNDGFRNGDSSAGTGINNFTGNIAYNTTNGNGSDGQDFVVELDFNGDIRNNTANMNADDGFQILGINNFTGHTVSNTANNNFDDGFRVVVDLYYLGDFSHNTGNMNNGSGDGDGIKLEDVNTFTGNATGNTGNNNDGNGIQSEANFVTPGFNTGGNTATGNGAANFNNTPPGFIGP
ncbi:MAG: hypothetical protein AAF591_10505 [Verrucomicrobiota bacterium]